MNQKEISSRFYNNRKESGLCPRCGKPLDREGYYCSQCLIKVREYHRQNRKFYRDNHICTECGKVIVPDGERICPECRAKKEVRRKPLTDEQKDRYKEKFKKYQKFLYQQRSAAGICTRCGKRNVLPGRKKCGICLSKDSEIHKAHRMDRFNIREYRKENHLCYFCGNPIDVPNSKSCSSCREKFRKISLQYNHDNEYWRNDNKIIFRGKNNERNKVDQNNN